jgi:hypothetical protein
MHPTSKMLADAIAFAKTDMQIARKLDKRDRDEEIHIRQIICKMERYSEEPDNFYLRIIFDYAPIEMIEGLQPDFYIDLEPKKDGTFKILPPPKNYIQHPNYDT